MGGGHVKSAYRPASLPTLPFGPVPSRPAPPLFLHKNHIEAGLLVLPCKDDSDHTLQPGTPTIPTLELEGISTSPYNGNDSRYQRWHQFLYTANATSCDREPEKHLSEHIATYDIKVKRSVSVVAALAITRGRSGSASSWMTDCPAPAATNPHTRPHLALTRVMLSMWCGRLTHDRLLPGYCLCLSVA